METIKAIASRKSVRGYNDSPLAENVLEGILAAGCAAPVGMAAYETLRLTVVQDKAALAALGEAISQAGGRGGDPLYGASTLVVISSQPPAAPGLDYVNAGCIAENMMLAAADAGVGSVIVWGTGVAAEADAGQKRTLGVPEGCKALFGVALGYAAAPDNSEKPLKVSIATNRV